ncbi:MAG: alcohol dehydrogenase catalytic domain-containing protein [Chthonomonas sp.]|nr:alcohol dehydrogenase catalytic domain-containing protein [Chthonomonas sp.]
MKLARYHGAGVVRIEDEPEPICPPRGLLIQTEACGLCSGELMDWYMDRKVPHVLGHEVCGRVIESQDDRFSVGARVFPHHHAPCLNCDLCRRGHTVHCPQWKRTKLVPGGMAERFQVSAENLNDTLGVNHIAPGDAALIEPLACVEKSKRRARWAPEDRTAVIGLGVMGLMHALLCPGAIGFELNPDRRSHAESLGIAAESDGQYDVVFVCPGSQAAIERALELAAPGARIVLFAPLPPKRPMPLDLDALYFRDLEIITCYSCGPEDTRAAMQSIEQGLVRADQLVSHRITLDELPDAYLRMKRGEILKPMVFF